VLRITCQVSWSSLVELLAPRVLKQWNTHDIEYSHSLFDYFFSYIYKEEQFIFSLYILITIAHILTKFSTVVKAVP
jgi:hypothetical protein